MKAIIEKITKISCGLLFVLLLFGTSVNGNSIPNNFSLANKPVLALLPFANHSGHTEAPDSIRSVFEHFITEQEITFISNDKLRKTLRKYRIRSLGSIDIIGANKLSDDLGVDLFLIGSIDIYSSENQPQLALSLRWVDADSLRVCWAKSVSAIGSDYATILGLGEIDNLHKLSELLISELVSDLKLSLANYTGNVVHTKNIAVIPFDDLEPNSTAGAIISSQLLSKLFQYNISVIEPGEVNRVCRNLGKFPRGEINLNLLHTLADSLDVDLIITGTLDYISSFQLQPEQSNMEISMGARLVETSTGKILAASELQRSHERGGLLNGGSGSILNVLVKPVLKELLNDLDIKKRTQIVNK